MKKALVLSGGANRGAFQVGVLKRWMAEQGREYDIIVGNSVGAINAACLSQTPLGKPELAIERLEELWLTRVDNDQIYKRWFPFGRLHGLWLKSLYNSQPLVDLLSGIFDHELAIKSGRTVAVGAVSLDTGECKYVNQADEKFLKWIIASASLPVFFAPVEIEGKLWSDGCIRSMAPIDQAVALGADEIDVIMTSDTQQMTPWKSISKKAIPDQIIRVITMMGNKGVLDDIELLKLRNELGHNSHHIYRPVKINIAFHNDDINYNSLDFCPQTIEKLIKMGHDSTKVKTMVIE